MATFRKKQWNDRVSTNPNRRVLTDTTSGTTQTVDITRAEGQVTVQGDAFNATNMNDLEDRIDEVVTGMNSNFQAGVEVIATALRNNGGTVPQSPTPNQCAAAVPQVKTAGVNQGRNDIQYDTLHISARAYYQNNQVHLVLTIKNASISGAPLIYGYSGAAAANEGIIVEQDKSVKHSYNGRIQSANS